MNPTAAMDPIILKAHRLNENNFYGNRGKFLSSVRIS